VPCEADLWGSPDIATLGPLLGYIYPQGPMATQAHKLTTSLPKRRLVNVPGKLCGVRRAVGFADRKTNLVKVGWGSIRKMPPTKTAYEDTITITATRSLTCMHSTQAVANTKTRGVTSPRPGRLNKRRGQTISDVFTRGSLTTTYEWTHQARKGTENEVGRN
jgi:hypothetical protein